MKPLKFQHFYGTYESKTRAAGECCQFVNENKIEVVSLIASTMSSFTIGKSNNRTRSICQN